MIPFPESELIIGYVLEGNGFSVLFHIEEKGSGLCILIRTVSDRELHSERKSSLVDSGLYVFISPSAVSVGY